MVTVLQSHWVGTQTPIDFASKPLGYIFPEPFYDGEFGALLNSRAYNCFGAFSSLLISPCAANVPESVALPFRIHSKHTAMSAPSTGPTT